MSDPVFAVGIPFRNPGRFFASALRSVFAQTLHAWELWLVDDGSQDGSLELACSLADPRVHVLSDGLHRGLASRLNQISQLVQVPYLARMDADDIMHPERLQRQLAAVQQAQGPTVIGSCAYAIDAHNQVVGFTSSVPPGPLRTEHTLIHPTIAAPTAWFREHPYSEDPAFVRCEDAELWIRAASDTVYAVLPQALLYYREVGTFSLEKYLATQSGLRAVVRRHGPRSWTRRQHRLWQLSFKMLAARVIAGLGQSDRLVRRRSRPLTPAEAMQARAGLSLVEATPLPGSPR